MSFFCGRDPFCEVVWWSENTHGELTSLLEWPAGLSLCLRDQRISPFAWVTSGSLPSVQIYRPYIVFSSPMRKYEHPLRLTYFSVYGWLSELKYFQVFFLVICWSYLRMEISVTLSIGNKLYSLSCENTLLMLSCNCIESAKFIVASLTSILHLARRGSTW